MLYNRPASHTQDYITEDQRQRIQSELERVQSFNRNREPIEYFDKLPSSPFAGLTIPRIEWFLQIKSNQVQKGISSQESVVS